MRAIPPSEGFCHGIELDDQKIVTLSRYLYQHVRPMSEVIQNPGSGFPQREPRMDRTPQVAQTGAQVEVQDKQESGDVEMTVKPLTKGKRRILSERTPQREHETHRKWNSRHKCQGHHGVSSPWMLEESVTAGAEPWPRLSSWRQGNHRKRRKQVLPSMERPCALELQRGSRRQENSKNRLPSMTNGGPTNPPEEWVESCARPRRGIDGVHCCRNGPGKKDSGPEIV